MVFDVITHESRDEEVAVVIVLQHKLGLMMKKHSYNLGFINIIFQQMVYFNFVL